MRSQGYLSGRFFAELQPVDTYPVALVVVIKGTYGRQDLDNTVGAYCDALVKARIISDDNMNRVSCITTRFKKQKDFFSSLVIIDGIEYETLCRIISNYTAVVI